MISCLRKSLCYLPTCLHPIEIVVYMLYRKSRDKLSSRIAVLFADLPTPNRNRYYYLPICLPPTEIIVYLSYRKSRDNLSVENRCAICRSAYTQPKSWFTFYIGSHVISCLREWLCYLPICLHPIEIVVYILYRKSRDKLSLRIAVLFADLPTPNRNRCLHIGSHVICCLREWLCYLPICLHPIEIVVYILYRKSRDKLSSRIAVLFADLPTPNRNRCLHFISEVTW